jgi:hypothetical protein
MFARLRVGAIQEVAETMTQMMTDTKGGHDGVELACRAPSLHNVDPRRTVTSTDRSGREAIISCGAALDHFRVAMAAVGWHTNVEQFDDELPW